MSVERDDVCILIPTLNEVLTIESLIGEFTDMGFSHILVIDGNSRDGTAEAAKRAGATVVVQSGRGKGSAIIEAFSMIKEPYILMLDGDGTYSPSDADLMLAPLATGADHVIGERLSGYQKGALTRLNHFGNYIINVLFKWAHGTYLEDILSGYRAFTRESLSRLNLKESGFEIETEIAAEAVRNELNVAVVPISYCERPGTPTKLNPLRDGYKIIRTIYKLAKVGNPLFYFGLIGFLLTVGGILVGTYVVYYWMMNIERIPMTILTGLLIMSGLIIFMFGVLGDMLLAYHRETGRELRKLQKKIDRLEKERE
ncbi:MULTISPECIES: S-layer glycoprotein N-glycosyltransferase AglJ [Methanocalculus]|uniref:S-layer glycoprotein N-glycosyltransferase AglJ n=2 Tax=Methanocalculaceae TaxID=1460864 RepID=UPI00209FA747|nr:S-layer glycoprotein N-glycosyltransferase AglJ [Methanocalculus sp. AMF5]MCP1662819.1 dolichol-phosphate mannosyltransferase [Methanocalculus sp. AMF5]